VGKSTLLKQTVDDLLARGWPSANVTYFDFSDPRLSQGLGAWEVAEVDPGALSADWPRALLFDEISRSTNWDLWLKQAVDQGGFRLVATDSAASLLRLGAQESGVGRWDELRMEGLTFPEFVSFNAGSDESASAALARQPDLLERYLALGGFPEHVWSESFGEVRERIRQDVAERTMGDLLRFDVDVERARRLFVYLVQESGTILNIADRASDLGADPRPVKKWVELLETAALLAPLPQHTGGKASSRLRSRPKLYACDHGLVTAFAVAPTDAAELRPKVFETVVFRHLREVASARRAELRYFRQNHSTEIDFVVDLEDRRVGVEVTSSRSKWQERLLRLERAGSEVKADRLVLVHGGLAEKEEPPLSKVVPVPLVDFLIGPEIVLAEATHG
jgi:predicted AAA+ superfamily ATPase